MAEPRLTLRVNAVMQHQHVLVQSEGDERLYADVETFLTWLGAVHRRCVEGHIALEITTARTPGAPWLHDEDVPLRQRIGESSAGESLTA